MAHEFKIRNGLLIGDTTAVDSVLDEDDMSSDSATALATQQSIKAYADSVGGRPVTQVLTVGQAGSNVDYNTIKEAVDAAVAGGASSTSQWEIKVYPGVYVEQAMTIPAGVNVVSQTNRLDTAFVVAADSTDDLFTLAGGYLCGLNLSGVTTTDKALVRADTAGTLNVCHGISFNNCDIGLAASNGATLVCSNLSCLISDTGQSVTTGVYATGAGTFLAISGSFATVPSAVLPGYTDNPIDCMFKIRDSAEMFMNAGTFRIAPKDSSADVICVDSEATAFVASCEFSGCGNALHIGSSGSNSIIITQGSSFKDNILNTFIESSTGNVYVNQTVDAESNSITSGGNQLGLVQYRDENRVRLLGDVDYRYVETTRDIDLGRFFNEWGATGVSSGGEVTSGTGLAVDVAAGTGWVRRKSTYNDLHAVSWDASSELSVSDSTTNYIIYDASAEAIQSTTSSPGYADTILLATVVTDSTGIRYIHTTRNYLDSFLQQLRDYLLSTRKTALDSGLTVSTGTTSTNIDIGSGSYYLGLDNISYAGDSDATFSYFYGSNGANEVASQTDIDDAQYDNAGTLTSLSSGYFKADTVVLTSDGRINVIYGTDEYATQSEAEVAPSANIPTFMEASAIYLANLIIEEGSGIQTTVDLRPQPATGGGGGGGTAGVSDHGALSGLSDDDHTQYLLIDGSRAMSGSFDMGTNAITNVGDVDGVNVSSHASRHNPGGSDALSTGTPEATQVGATPDAGSASSYALSDHQHGIANGTPSAIGTANSAGTASTVASSDHVHDHGSQTDGSHHAAVTTSVNGFMLAADKVKLDDATATPTADSIVISDASGTVDDWVTSGDLTEETSSILTITGGTDAVLGSGASIEVAQADSTTNGYLSSIDWNTFNDKVDNASNVGTAGVGVFKQLSSTTLQLKNINIGSNKLSITDDTANDEIDLDVVESNIVHQNLSGAGTNTHGDIDTHIADDTIHFAASSVAIGTLSNVTVSTPADNEVLAYDDTSSEWINQTAAEAGLATSADLTNHTDDSTIHFTEANIDHTNIANIGTNTHAQIDSHIASTANPHSVSKSDVSLDNVTNDAQLKREAGDIDTFTEKGTPVDADIVLIEDSADSYNKKKVQLSNLPGGDSVGTFLDLTDTPSSYTAATSLLSVNATADGIIETGVALTESTDAFTLTEGSTSLNVTASSTVDQDLQQAASPTWDTVYGTTFDTNVSAAGVTLSGTSLTADGTDSNIDISILAKGDAGIVISDLSSAPSVTTNKLYSLNGELYFDGVNLESGSGGGISAVVEDTSPELGGNLDLNQYYIQIDSSPDSNLTGSGIIAEVTIDASASIGDALCMSSDGHYDLADANASGTVPVVGIALESGSGTKKILLRGTFRNDSWSWSVGDGESNLLYASSTAGDLTQSPPSTAGDYVQVVGRVLSSTTIYFDPQLTMVEVG